ncbi:MAG: hypothetical protein ACJ72Z_12200 [Pyrinomonadaceae bacterium]
MNFKNIKLVTFTLFALSVVVFTASSTVLAVSGCQKVKGIENGALNPDGSGASGTITQGGKLNGSSQVVLMTGFIPTGDPFTFTFTDNLTLTTNEGILRTHNVSLFDTANGLSTAVARIDPNTSEGIFANATGVLYLNAKVTNAVGGFQAEITGEVCFAN